MKPTDRQHAERKRPDPSVRLRALHWLVVFGSVGITLFAWNASRSTLIERTASRFDREAERVVALFSEQLQRHADVLQATASLLTMRPGRSVTHDEWRRYNDKLELPTLFPALNGLNVVSYVRADELDAFEAAQRKDYPGFAVHPASDQPFYLPVTHSRDVRSPVLGFDMAHDPIRRSAVARAVASGETRITAPIQLTYSQKPGLLMFTPFYRGEHDDWTGTGTDAIAGAVLALVQIEKLASGVLDRDKRLVWVHILDDGRTLYDEHDETHAGGDSDPLFKRTLSVPLFGRDWQFDVESTAAFRRDATSIEPLLILAGGLAIDALLMLILTMITRSAAALQEKSDALESSNRTLESLAHAATHDLKTPLNGIGVLAGFIEEDLEDLSANDSPLSDLRRNVSRIQRQVRRGRTLIDGILEYSGLNAGDGPPTRVDTRELVEAIGDTLLVEPDRLVLDGEFPVLLTSETRLSQVLGNLIGNAFKYHHDPASARVTVSVEQAGQSCRFSVADNGPGIDPADHERIFELFETVGPRVGSDSTGVGLSIVKKTVEGLGGQVCLNSAPGQGTTFSFDWPEASDAAQEDGGEPGQDRGQTEHGAVRPSFAKAA